MSIRMIGHDDSRSLLRWLPVQILMLALMLVGGVATVQVMDRSANLVKDTVTIKTDGATGRIEQGQLLLDLPVKVYNGTDFMVVGVNLWTQAFACPDEDAPTRQCTRLHSSEQALTMRVPAGSSASDRQVIRSGLPSNMAGTHIRIERKVTNVTSDIEAAEQRMLDQP